MVVKVVVVCSGVIGTAEEIFIQGLRRLSVSYGDRVKRDIGFEAFNSDIRLESVKTFHRSRPVMDDEIDRICNIKTFKGESYIYFENSREKYDPRTARWIAEYAMGRGFLHVARGVYVNPRYIVQLRGNRLIMRCGFEEIEISRKYRREVQRAISINDFEGSMVND